MRVTFDRDHRLGRAFGQVPAETLEVRRMFSGIGIVFHTHSEFLFFLIRMFEG